jgi:two-component system phosphate regulon sensor histidine kinase PhoR
LSRPASQYIAALAAAILLAAAVGFLLGRTVQAVAIALALILGLQLRNLLRFERWLRRRAVEAPPSMRGLWGEVLAITSRIYRRKVFHKRRVLVMLREFRRMTAAMPDGALLLSANREILWFNRIAGKWLGLRRKADQGIRFDNLLRHPDLVEYLDRNGTGTPPRLNLGRHGEQWLAFHLVTANTTGQKLLIVRDVTSEARLEAMRKDFVANASHELRSPLTVIGGYLDSLREDPSLDAAWRGPVEEMRRQSDRMGRIVQDLLELSRLEAQSGEAERTPVDVGGMLALLRKEVLSRSEHPARFQLCLDSEALLLGSEGELHSVFANLVSNAAKYTPPDGSITVRWWTDGQGGHVSVEDTGIGIAAEHIPRLTERFYRVDAGRSRKLGGSGLGLAIVKHALQRHGGDLQIQSEEGKGSTFTCHFPVSRVEQRR